MPTARPRHAHGFYLCLATWLTFALAPIARSYSTADFAYTQSLWGFIDREGQEVIPATFTSVRNFSEGLAAVKTGGSHFIGGKWGFINREGKVIIEPTFDAALDFHEGLASVMVGGRWGVIDTHGKWVVEPAYSSIGFFSDGLAPFAPFREQGSSTETQLSYGFIDRQGTVVIQPKFSQVSYGFNEGLAAVAIDHLPPTHPNERIGNPGPFGFIDRTGNWVILPRFSRGGRFSEGLAAVPQVDQYGYIDRSGEWVIQPRFKFSWQQDLSS